MNEAQISWEASHLQYNAGKMSTEYLDHCRGKYLPKLSAAASPTLKKAAKGLKNLEDTSFGKPAAVDASKPAGGKAAKARAAKPSGGGRLHDPEAKTNAEDRLRGRAERRPEIKEPHIRWGWEWFKLRTEK